MKTASLKVTVALSLFVGAMTLGPADGIELRYAFQNGKIYKYKTTMEFFDSATGEAKAGSVKPLAEISVGVSISVTKMSSAGDQSWKVTVDTVGMRMIRPEGEHQVLTFEQLKGKSMQIDIDDRGVSKSVRAEDPSTLKQTKELGFELFSRDLLNFLFIFPEYPEDTIQMNRPWRFSRTDTTSRGGQRIIVTRSTECRVVGTAEMASQICHKIAYTVTTRIRSQSVNGETTATGLLYSSVKGIPIKSETSIKAVFSVGGSETIQKRIVKTVLE